MTGKTNPPRGAVLISGAAGGIGSAAVRRLDELGFQVFAGVRRGSDGDRLRRDVSPRVTPLVLDITDSTAVAGAAETVARSTGQGGLAALVNNAGIIVEGPVELIPLEEIRREFEVNVIGHVAVTQAFLPLLRRARGRVINIGAPTGQVAVPYLGILSASKAALESVTDALRTELRPWGIAVSIIEPGAMETAIFRKSAAAAEEFRRAFSPELRSIYAPALEAVAKASSRQRLESPQVVADAIAEALTSRTPRTRYLAGRGTGLIPILRLLPDRVRDALLLRAFGLAGLATGS